MRFYYRWEVSDGQLHIYMESVVDHLPIKEIVCKEVKKGPDDEGSWLNTEIVDLGEGFYEVDGKFWKETSVSFTAPNVLLFKRKKPEPVRRKKAATR